MCFKMCFYIFLVIITHVKESTILTQSRPRDLVLTSSHIDEKYFCCYGYFLNAPLNTHQTFIPQTKPLILHAVNMFTSECDSTGQLKTPRQHICPTEQTRTEGSLAENPCFQPSDEPEAGSTWYSLVLNTFLNPSYSHAQSETISHHGQVFCTKSLRNSW